MPEQNPTPLPYTREYFEAKITASAVELAEAMAQWMSRDREASLSETYHLASRIRVISRSISADTAALGDMSNEEYQRTAPKARTTRKRPAPSFDGVLARMNGGR